MSKEPDFSRYDDNALQSVIRMQSDIVIAAAERLSRKKEDVVEAQTVLKLEERFYDQAVAEGERRWNP